MPKSSGEEFGQLLGRYLAETHTSVRRLEHLSGVPRRTIENWLYGSSRPRGWEPVLRAAHALHLSAAQTDDLLRAAALPPLSELRAANPTGEQLELLMRWGRAPNRPTPPFPPATCPPHSPPSSAAPASWPSWSPRWARPACG